MKTRLLGMGSPILSDDAIGVRLATDLKAALPTPRRSRLDIIEECSVGGINLLDLLSGYERVIVLDSIQTSGGTPGAWHRFTADALRETVHLTNIHDANFATVLELGRRLHLPVPDDAEIHIFAVEIEDNRTFSERMTPALEQAYPRLRTAIFHELSELLNENHRTAPGTDRP
jgi:hydrogenase maturation protease